MTDLNQGKQKKKITYTASFDGIAKVERAMKQYGIASKLKFSERIGVSRNTLNNFFQRIPIELDGFQNICNGLNLKWEEIMEIAELPSHHKIKMDNYYSTIGNDEAETETTLLFEDNNSMDCKNNTDKPIDKTAIIPTDTKLQAFAVTGTIDPENAAKIKATLALLKQLSGDLSIEIIDIEPGSIKLTLDGSQEGLERLEALFKSGVLTKEFADKLGITVEEVQFVTPKTSKDDKGAKTIGRKRLAFTIAGDLNLDDIAALKVAIANAGNDEETKTDEQPNLIQEGSSQQIKHKNLRIAKPSRANVVPDKRYPRVRASNDCHRNESSSEVEFDNKSSSTKREKKKKLRGKGMNFFGFTEEEIISEQTKIVITKKTIRFENEVQLYEVYQLSSVRGFGLVTVKRKNIFFMRFFLGILALGFLISNFPEVTLWGTSMVVLALGCYILNNSQPKKEYGLKIYFDSEEAGKIFITSDMKALKEIINTLYDYMESDMGNDGEDIRGLEIYISQTQVSINEFNSYGMRSRHR